MRPNLNYRLIIINNVFFSKKKHRVKLRNKVNEEK